MVDSIKLSSMECWNGVWHPSQYSYTYIEVISGTVESILLHLYRGRLRGWWRKSESPEKPLACKQQTDTIPHTRLCPDSKPKQWVREAVICKDALHTTWSPRPFQSNRDDELEWESKLSRVNPGKIILIHRFPVCEYKSFPKSDHHLIFSHLKCICFTIMN